MSLSSLLAFNNPFMGLSVSPSPIEVQEEADVRSVRNNRLYELPPDGLVLPQQIELLTPIAARDAIIRQGQSLGLTMPPSYNRQRLIDRMQTHLRDLTYQQNGNRYTREHPVRLMPRQTSQRQIDQPEARPRSDIQLPELVPFSIFATLETLRTFIQQNQLQDIVNIGASRLKADIIRDLREFLSNQGYSISPRGDFARQGGITLRGGYEFRDLIKYQEYIRLINGPSISISQSDLIRLNLSLSELLSRLTSRRWPSFDEFLQTVGTSINIDPTVIQLAVLLERLPHESNAIYTQILRDIGDNRNYRKSADRKNAIYTFLRAKLQLVPTNYTRRESLKGPAPSTVNFSEAIKQGYQLDPEQYQTEIDDLLDDILVAPSQRKFLIELLEHYPDMFTVMREYRPSTTLVSGVIRLYYNDPPSMVQQLYSFSVNYPLMFPETPEKTQRRQQINKLPNAYIDALYGVYRTRDIEHILDVPQNPLELYLHAIAKVKVEHLANLVAGCGMLIPEHLLTRQIRAYVLNHLPEYSTVINRPKDIPAIQEVITTEPSNTTELINMLRNYTDQEIITYFGYTGGFDTRNALVENMYQTLTEEGFMVYREVNPDLATNQTTFILTDIADVPSPYLVFGTPLRYRVLELDELLHALRYEDNAYIFQKIGSSGMETYTLVQISRLQSLLPAMRNMNGAFSETINILLERIRAGLVQNMKRDRRINNLRDEINDSPDDIQQLVKNIFYRMFYAGMYMRRWRGPGNRYPVQESQTRSRFDPQPKTNLALIEFYNDVEALERINPQLANTLKEVSEIQYNTEADQVTILTARIFGLIETVSKGDYCIREASRKLVQTAHYYLSIFFMEVIPDFDPHSVDSIS